MIEHGFSVRSRRAVLAGGLALATAPLWAATPASGRRRFPKGFLWGAATAGHQVEGNNVNSDLWLLEHLQPTTFAEPSGDAVNSFELWPTDLDLVRSLGLNGCRFSLEWSRIEPEPGQFSIAILDHYLRIIEGCRARGLKPLVTFNHFTTPRWFAARGGWLQDAAPQRFAAFCDRAARHLAGGISHAMTLNEPNLTRLLRMMLPEPVFAGQRAMLAAAAQASGTARYVAGNAVNPEDIERMTAQLVAGHKAARAAIKAVRGDLPIGVTLAMVDDQADGSHTAKRDAVRADLYGAWLEAARGDDFIGVQNYERAVWGEGGRKSTPPGVPVNYMGSEVYAPSLAGAVRYAHQATGLPVIVTEHGVGTDDDAVRAAFIPAALSSLHDAMNDGVPVHGYVHWSLLDNFEWIFGYGPKYGLYAVDRQSFRRTAKPSAAVYAAIARRNAL